MKKIKYILILFLCMIFLTGCDVEIPTKDISCTYYIPKIYTDDATTIYQQLDNIGVVDANKEITLSIDYNYMGEIDTKEELEQALSIKMNGLKTEPSISRTELSSSGFEYIQNFSGQQIELSFVYEDGLETCPNLFYEYYSDDGIVHNFSFNKNIIHHNDLYITSENPNLSEDEKPQYQYCNFKCESYYNTAGGKKSEYFHLYVRVDEKQNYGYFLKRVDSLDEKPNFSSGVYGDVETLTQYDYFQNVDFELYDLNSIKDAISFDEDGNIICREIPCEKESGILGSQNGEISIEESIIVSGIKFKKRMEALQPYIEELANQKGISIPEDKMNLKIDGENYSFPWFGNVDSSIDEADVESTVINMLEETWKYCIDEIYTRKVEETEDGSVQLRKEECDSFRIMVEDAESLGLIENITSECGMLSSDFTSILKDILDLIKIAGPILALGLGTVDFIKAMASGDADKEMKSAWKRFITRIIAAILLFLIPIILAFILDRFLGNTPGNGYNPDNPFCIDTGIGD